MTVRRFTGADAAATSAMIARSLRDSCVRDYGETAIEALIGRLQPDDLLKRAAHTHFYVAEDGGAIVGTHWTPGDDPYSITPGGSVVRAFAEHGWDWGGNAWAGHSDPTYGYHDYMPFSYFGR